MPRQTQAQKETTKTETKTEEAKPHSQPDAIAAAKEKGEKLKAEMDAMLDEIDGVLEEDAVAFVNSYIQKGGQ